MSMRSYTIIKALALSLGAVSVTALGLPEQRRSEINARAAGGYGFDNPLQKLEHVTVNIDVSVSEDINLATTSDLDNLKERLANIGLIPISEGILGENVHTGTYSIPTDATFSKRDTTLEKRGQVSIEGAKCLTACGFDKGVTHPNPDDCTVVYNTLYSKATQFNLNARTVTYYVYQSCAGFLINNTADSLAVYDFWDYGGSTQWLNGNCIVQKQAAIGTCIFSDTFGPSFQSSVYISVSHPSYFGV